KYMVNGFASQENLIDDMQAGATCAPVTDYNTFANRLIDVSSDTSVTDAYGTCFTCADPQPWSLVKFAVDMNQYAGSFTTAYVAGEFNGWCGGCNPLSDNDGDGVWTGSITTVLDSFQYKFQLDQWAASENLGADDDACTKSDGNFRNRFITISQDTVCLDTVCYEECTPCATAPATATITFIVDMSLEGSIDPSGVHVAGSFQGWNPSGTPMTDIGGGQWSVTVPGIPVGQAIEFKYINGNFWGPDESVFGPCGAGNGNRIFTPTTAGPVTIGPDCFGSCGPCLQPVDITFIVDLTYEGQADSNGVHIVGPFNNFDPNATVMTPIGNNQYSVTLSGFQPGTQFNFKYINGNDFSNAENVASGACAANNGFGDRTYLVPSTNSVVGPDCFNLCGPCPPCPQGQVAYEIFIGASNSQFPNEMSWELINLTTGDTVIGRDCGSYGPSSADTVCLDTGNIYVFNANDDWGDGWNGGFYIITDLSDNSTLASGFPNNTQPGDFTDDCNGADVEATVTFEGGGAAIIPGCTDPAAINYNPQATVEDSSCNFAAVNDVCDSALALTVIGVSDTCDYVVQSTNNATDDSTSQSLCDPVGINLDLWYTFVAPPSGNINFDIILGTTPLVEAAIYEACGDSVIGCFNTQTGTAFSGFTPGQQYVLQIWTDDFNAGIYGICLQEFVAGCTDPLATNYNPSANVDDGSCIYPVPVNDNCQDAISISCGGTAAGLTLGASADTTLQPCGTFLSTAPGVWYKLVGNGDTAVIATCGSDYDTKLGVFTGGCNNLTCVTGNDDACGPVGGPPRQSIVKFPTQNGVTYLVYVTGFAAEAGQYTLSVDCIPTKCKSPKNVNSTQLTASTAQLCWDPTPGANNYVIRGNKVGTSGYVYIQTSSTCKTVGGLQGNMSYYWQVQAVCSGNSTNPVSPFSKRDTFTMLPCAGPTGVMTSNVTSSSATLSWDAVPGAIGYKIRGREAGTNSYANITVTNNSYTATGLKPNTNYEWTVRVVCSNGVTSNASAVQTFTTGGGAKTGAFVQSDLNMNVYPNPAKNYFVLSAGSLGTLENVQIQIFDLSGKMIHGLNNVNITGSIEINLPENVLNGMYQIMVTHEGQVYQEKLVIVR
ncbi:MAG: T9SS type A sorting domain-containing protein, partial [Chitinophagales bacterium]|nr:T9SS type A sorting domain-containing protein [Chitinophagales bacterium]